MFFMLYVRIEASITRLTLLILSIAFLFLEPVPKALVDDHAGIQALSQFTTPKQTLNTLLQSSNLPNSNKLARYETRRIKEVYQTVLRLNWPQEFAITGLGRKKVDSERAAAALACVQLQVRIDDKKTS